MLCEWGFPGGASSKEPAYQCRRLGFDPWVGETPWKRAWKPTSEFLPRKSHGERSLVGYSPRVQKELDTTEQLNNTTTTIFLPPVHPWLQTPLA